MSSETWKIEKDLCRCCHGEGSFQNLAEPRKHEDIDEFYSDMLKECFDIDMVPVSGVLCAATYTICDSCIVRLRDASEFKQQVLSCEDRFRNMYERNVIKVSDLSIEVDVKQEVIDTEEDEDFPADVPQDDDDDHHFEQSIELNKKPEIEIDKPAAQVGIEKQKKPAKPKKTVKKTTRRSAKKNGEQETEAEDQGAVKKRGRRRVCIVTDEEIKQVGDAWYCSRCDKTYNTRYALTRHIKYYHYNEGRYKFCSICSKKFSTQTQLVKHKLDEHNVDARLKCNACEAVFNMKRQLTAHYLMFHKLGAIIKCQQCDYETHGKYQMQKHLVKHTVVKNHHCRFCKKSFLRKNTLRQHERIHTGDKRKVCAECGQAFVQKASLNYHMMKYHPEVNF